MAADSARVPVGGELARGLAGGDDVAGAVEKTMPGGDGGYNCYPSVIGAPSYVGRCGGCSFR